MWPLASAGLRISFHAPSHWAANCLYQGAYGATYWARFPQYNKMVTIPSGLDPSGEPRSNAFVASQYPSRCSTSRAARHAES